jgi:hypothetical protein
MSIVDPAVMVRLLLIATLAATSCASPAPLEGRGCPCAPGYKCCAAVCVAEAQRCAEDAAQDGPAVPPIDAGADIALDGPIDAAPSDAGGDGAAAEGPRDQAADLAPDRPPDLAPDLPPDAPPPRWQTLGGAGLVEHLALWFDLEIAPDGTPFVAMEKLMPPGRSRVTIVLRYDGVAWQKVGEDLSGADVAAFAIAPDGTPIVQAFDVIYAFQQGQWKPLPDVGQGFSIPTRTPTLGLDRNGRIHIVVFDAAGEGLSVMRFNGTSWELVGRPNVSAKRLPSFLAFDASGPYLAFADLDALTTEVRRSSGSDWVVVGGGPIYPFTASAFAVTPDGTSWAISADSTAVAARRAAAGGAWMETEPLFAFGATFSPTPGVDVTPEGVLYLAYLADRDPGPDVVPGPLVVRRDGSRWTELATSGLDPNVFDAIELAVDRRGGRDVPYIAYVRANQLIVKKLE